VHRFAVTVGAPGTETPTRRLAVTGPPRGDLNPAYGCCAVAISATQPQLPSGWLGGNRIAIHGTSGPLGVAASSGCVRAADADVSKLVSQVPLGTPVIIRS
jgi:lipoprotein-anchoring transpeptidase ErfK/SrfK